MFDECLVFIIQIDGSVSKQMEDNKCISWQNAVPSDNMSTLLFSPQQKGMKSFF